MFDLLLAGIAGLSLDNAFKTEGKRSLFLRIISSIGAKDWDRDVKIIFLNKVETSSSLQLEDKELLGSVVESVIWK